MYKKFIYFILLSLCSCSPYKNSWWNPTMPYDGECLYVLKLNDIQYKNYLVVDAKDSLLVYKNTMGDGEYYRLTPNVGFGYNKDYFSDATLERIDACSLRDSSFLYPLHDDYYVIYPIFYRKYAPMSHRVTNIAWGDICNYDKDTLQLLEYPYQIPQYQVTERMVREYLRKTKNTDEVTYEEVFEYINMLIDNHILESTCSTVYFTETGGYSFRPFFE